MNVVFFSLLLFFESIQQAALVNFMLYLNISFKQVYLSKIFLAFFLKRVYCTMVAEKFRIHGVKDY